MIHSLSVSVPVERGAQSDGDIVVISGNRTWREDPAAIDHNRLLRSERSRAQRGSDKFEFGRRGGDETDIRTFES